MIKLYINCISVGLQQEAVPSNSYNVSLAEDYKLQEGASDRHFDRSTWLNVFVASSRYNEIKKCASDGNCELYVNILKYSDENSIVPKSSVEAISRLTKTRRMVLRELMSQDSNTGIAARLCRSVSTIKRHVQDIYDTTNLNNRCHAVCAYLRFLLEYQCYTGSEIINSKSKNHENPTRNSKNM